MQQNDRGLWLSSRKDSKNQARADVAGKMTESPQEVWSIATGGEVSFARDVKVDGNDAVLVQVGSNLELIRWTGESIWRKLKLGVGLVMHVDDFDGDGQQEVLVKTDARTVALIDLSTGRELWSWQSDSSTFISGRAFYKTSSGIRFISFPSYSLNGYCFDFSGDCENPKLLWKKNYSGKYASGYGPSIVLKDMDGDGKLDIVLSGKHPSVYQAVIDVDTGVIKFDVHYDVDGWGRPYGLLQAGNLNSDGKPDVVMVCCQVEEYIAVARNVGGAKLEKIWGKFIEKDWPKDEKELRPQVTSLADVQDNGKVELIVGVWEDGMWRTLIIDPLKGYSAQRGCLEGYYFWGCYDLNGDDVPEIIVSTEGKRQPARFTRLLALDGKTFQPVAALEKAAIFVSTDSPLPHDTYFMALRRNPVFVNAADGTCGILVRKFDSRKEIGTFLWGGKAGTPVGTRLVAEAGFKRVDIHENSVLLSDNLGRIQRFDANLNPIGKLLATTGRTSRPLVWAVGGKHQLVLDVAGGTILGGVPNFEQNGKLDGKWQVAGSMPALHIDALGKSRVAAADFSDSDNPAALIYSGPVTSAKKPLRIPLSHPVYAGVGGLVPYGDTEFRLLVIMQTGVHTMALASYDAEGKLLWMDKKSGAYPKKPAAADINGDGIFEVLADDHGVFRIYDDAGAVVATNNGWPPAYTLPIVGPFGPEGETLTLRASGIDGIAMVDGAAKVTWQIVHGPPDFEPQHMRWRYYRSLAAVGDVGGDGKLMLGAMAEDCLFECIDTAEMSAGLSS